MWKRYAANIAVPIVDWVLAPLVLMAAALMKVVAPAWYLAHAGQQGHFQPGGNLSDSRSLLRADVQLPRPSVSFIARRSGLFREST